MTAQAIVVISNDKDFSMVVAEQVKRELSLACHVVASDAEAKKYIESAALVVASEPVKGFACPVLVPKARPFRLQALLEDIEHALHRPVGSDELALGSGYVLQVKQKQLAGHGKNIDLTDKEVQLLQCLAEGAEGVSKEQLLKTVWGYESALDTHTLETHIYRLRGKIRELSGEDRIVATAGGYGLNMEKAS